MLLVDGGHGASAQGGPLSIFGEGCDFIAYVDFPLSFSSQLMSTAPF